MSITFRFPGNCWFIGAIIEGCDWLKSHGFVLELSGGVIRDYDINDADVAFRHGWTESHKDDSFTITFSNGKMIEMKRIGDPQSLKEGDKVFVLCENGEYEYRTVKSVIWQNDSLHWLVGLLGVPGYLHAKWIYAAK
jgi:hypothetical protein